MFAVKVAGADVGGMDVATLDANRVDKLTAVLGDMTAITSQVETIDHPATEDPEAWTEKILHITITPRAWTICARPTALPTIRTAPWTRYWRTASP